MLTVKKIVRGVAGTRAELKRVARGQRIAIARGLTKTARDVQRTVQLEQLRVFNKPLPYVQRAWWVDQADANRPGPVQAAVYLARDPQYARHPITPQVLGGNRALKRFERSLGHKSAIPPGWYAVPTEKALDSGGKMKRGLIQQIVAQAARQQLAGYSKQLGLKASKKEKSYRVKAQQRAGGQFVFVTKRRGKLTPGIYLAEGSGVGKKMGPFRRNTLIPYFRYVPSVTYRQRLDFYGIARRIISQNAGRNVMNSLKFIPGQNYSTAV